MSKSINSILEIKRASPKHLPKNVSLKIGITIFFVSFLFIGVSWHLIAQYKSGYCDICGAAAEWKETHVYKSSGRTSGPPTYRCGRHKDSTHPGTITLWIGLLLMLPGSYFLKK